MRGKPRFSIGDKVRHIVTGVTGTILEHFWADAGDPAVEGYEPKDEHHRYYVTFRKQTFSVPESQVRQVGPSSKLRGASGPNFGQDQRSRS